MGPIDAGPEGEEVGSILVAGPTPEPRTLVDILRETSRLHPESSALEDERGALSYRELIVEVEKRAGVLRDAGVRPGSRIGVRLASGQRELYLGILSVLFAGGAYVPVDVDDPDERARLVFDTADVDGVLGGAGAYAPRDTRAGVAEAGERTGDPSPDDDAWIIFTSGSTGTPKGVAITHRSAAAFVDAEARMFLQDAPLGPGDRVLAGLSVGFDASCEEMWLAWGHGACLVPAPRALVKSGVDLGPWLTTRRINVVSTVPTLASLWPADALDNVRLLIFGGEACPPDLVARLATPDRELWNTYGPTEATVVACGAQMHAGEPVRIGLPLDGWELVIVDPDGNPVEEGQVGELVIGGVGLGRYLDPEKDAEKYAPLESVGWARAYRSGDLVRYDGAGLVFMGRADDQVKVGGRRIELGEIEAALFVLPNVAAATVAVRTSAAGSPVLVAYLVPGEGFDRSAALARLREELPAALVPVLALVDDLPTRSSGKVDKGALPWPLTGVADDDASDGLAEDEVWLREQWSAVLGLPVTDRSANFFDLGGGSLSAALLVARLRARDGEFAVAEIYAHPRFGAMLDYLRSRTEVERADTTDHRAAPVPVGSRILQTIISVAVRSIDGARWATLLLAPGSILAAFGAVTVLPSVSLAVLVPALILLATPPGRMALSAMAARLLLRGVRPGDYPRGGSVHLRIWTAERIAESIGASSLSGAPWILYYARALGARISDDVDLHTLPPITGMLSIGPRASIEPEVDLSGYWIDGDTVRVGAVRIGADARVGARSTLLPGTRIGKRASIAPGSSVFGRVKADQSWAGSPASRVGSVDQWWPKERPPRARGWLVAYGAASIGIAAIPVLGLLAGVLVLLAAIGDARSASELWGPVFAALVPAALVAGVVIVGLVVLVVRLLGIGLREGVHPVRSRIGWQVWMTERVLDMARALLFPLYASIATPLWLRLLGADIGRGVEASTVLLIPAMTTVKDGAFLADDTLVASYDLGGGYVRLARAEVGKRAFVGNSGMTGAGHVVPRDGLVAVLSAAPVKSKPGSSWMGSPPVRLRRAPAEVDAALTFSPPARLKIQRSLWEICRLVPVFLSCALGVAVGLALIALLEISPVLGYLLGGPLLVLAGAVAALVATAAKWTLIGRIRESEHPLWSSFIWRNEVADTFIEMLAAPWFAARAGGTPALVWWLRSLGARIGEGVWCETYWLPEADLVRIDGAATVNRGCVVQTHLFHDRVMALGSVHLEQGATLGPHSIVLPAATIGAGATVGPASLVIRGEVVPDGSRWSGNPIGPWREVRVSEYRVPLAK